MTQTSQLEFTVKAIIIGLIFSIIFCGANIYLGLKIGNTISASIPAAILSMIILRMFKKYSKLENSISQTIASVGESMASILIFIFPALLILHVWYKFDYWMILLVSTTGAIIGIIYSIILRKVLLDDQQLTFPEGQAIGKVLEATTKTANNKDNTFLLLGIAISSITAFCQIGLQVLSDSVYKIGMIGNRLFGGGVSFSIAIIGAGYLIGFSSMFVAAISSVFTWFIILPIFSSIHGVTGSDTLSEAFSIWKQYIRPIGVGVFIFTGLATILMLTKPIVKSIKESIYALKNINTINSGEDINIVKLLLVGALAVIPIIILMIYKLNFINQYGLWLNILISLCIMVILLIIGFATAAVSGYFAGLTGSTSSPVSGLLFIGVIVVGLLINMVSVNNDSTQSGIVEIVILLVAFVGGTAIITNGNIQDYKSGALIGSKPRLQQFALFLGLAVSALFAPLFIILIFNAYGIAGIVPHVGMDISRTLSAPQASAIAALTNNILGGNQNWWLIYCGILLGVIALTADTIGKKTKKFRCPMISIGVGIYLPPDIVIALFIGGLLNLLVTRKNKKNGDSANAHNESGRLNLFICGLIAGESLMGLILAIPFVIYQDSNVLKIVGSGFRDMSDLLSIGVIGIILWYIYKLGTKAQK